MPYERFEAWRLCHALVIETYRVTEQFPKRELYGLASQARRAAFSAAANIAEGSGKRGPREFRRYLDISLGSLHELSYTFRVANDLGYLTPADAASLNEARRLAAIMTWKLYDAMRRTRATGSP
ncbi:MAG: four helix bundle protein [Gemmatimonadota bacterium]|nr:four helix bundle protein [Gemmatimonadota bacterium]